MATPKLVVFDLDFTLWDCGGLWVDCTSPPFAKGSDGKVYDQVGRNLRLYCDVASILDELEDQNIPLGIASRTEQPAWAVDLLQRFEIRERFAFEEIFPNSKVVHFSALREKSGYEYDEMLFFDDERRNIIEVSELGVKCVEVSNGLTRSLFDHHFSL